MVLGPLRYMQWASNQQHDLMGFTWFPKIDWRPLYWSCVIVQSVHNSSNNRLSHLITCHLKCTHCNSYRELFSDQLISLFHLLSPGFPELGWAMNSPFRNTAEYLVVNATVQETETQKLAQATSNISIHYDWRYSKSFHLLLLFKVTVPTVRVSVILVMPFPFQ